MVNKQLKELWELRFHKILSLERESLHFYDNLIKTNQVFFLGSKTKEIIEGIMQDEMKHERLARGLIEIINHKEVSDGAGKNPEKGSG